MFLSAMINLKKVMKGLVYFSIFFLDIFTCYKVRKPAVFFNPSEFNQMSLIVISVDNSGVAGVMQKGRLT